jgi:hypothetical protein
MSAYKKLNQQDAYISTYTSRKSWVASGSQYRELGINNIQGLAGYENLLEFTSDNFIAGNQATTSSTEYNSKLIYESIEHLYYNEFEQALLTTTSSYESYLQSSFEVSGSRYLNNRIALFSLPKEMYGTHIEPNSISITPDLFNGTNNGTGSFDNYMDNNYATDLGVNSIATADNLYIENVEYLFGSSNPNCTLTNLDYIDDEDNYVDESVKEYLDHTNTSRTCNEIIDDGEGRLFFKFSEPRKYVGNVIYTHGQLIITDELVALYYNSYFNAVLKWKSNLPIFTHNYHCKIKSSEFNYSLNKTILETSDGLAKPFVTASFFNPYFTTVGLYNDSNELMAVAKLGRPTPKSIDTDMSVIVKLDMNFGSNRLLGGRVEALATGSNNPNPYTESGPPCSMYFTFRNYYRKGGVGSTWHNQTKSSLSKDYLDTGGYELFRKRTLATPLLKNVDTNEDYKKVRSNLSDALGSSFTQYDNSPKDRKTEKPRCYVDVQVDIAYNLTGELTYNLNYFKSDNSIPASGSYTPTDSLDRPIAFFRDKIMSYLLESNPSCDFDFEFLDGNLRDAQTYLGSTNILGRSNKY